MKKITIIVLHLNYGGLEKAVASLANMLCDKYCVNIISTYKFADKPAFHIDKRVNITYLMNDGQDRKKWFDAIKGLDFISFIKESYRNIKILFLKNASMISAIKSLDSDVIISTRSFHNKMVGKYAKKGIVKIAWEHSHHNGNKKYISKLIKSCKKIDYLVSVSKELNDYYSKHKELGNKCRYISLALDEIPSVCSKLNTKNIVSIGRLSKEKGFPDLIKVFKIVNQKHNDWHLNIVGDGLEKENIIKEIKQQNLEKVITMHGFKDKDELNHILSNSSIYVMTSFTESFGLVLIEAMSYGIPCLSFDSARGSLEIIDDKINGLIIKDRNKKEMASKIVSLIENDDLRKRMGKEAYKKSLNYSFDNVKREWIKLIEEALD